MIEPGPPARQPSAVTALCGGQAAGIALSPAERPRSASRSPGFPLIATQVARARREVIWDDRAPQGWCAATRIGDEPEAGFVRVRGIAPPPFAASPDTKHFEIDLPYRHGGGRLRPAETTP